MAASSSASPASTAIPPEVSRITRVGALLDPDVERILGLKPDLVVLYNTQIELKQRLDRAGIPYYSYEHRGAGGHHDDHPGRRRTNRLRRRAASSSPASIERGIAAVRSSVSRFAAPRTLLVFERDPSSLRDIYASGGYGFMHDMLDAAGGTDVFADIKQQSVQAGTELILARRPDVIVELRYGDAARTAATSARDAGLERARVGAGGAEPAACMRWSATSSSRRVLESSRRFKSARPNDCIPRSKTERASMTR